MLELTEFCCVLLRSEVKGHSPPQVDISRAEQTERDSNTFILDERHSLSERRERGQRVCPPALRTHAQFNPLNRTETVEPASFKHTQLYLMC